MKNKWILLLATTAACITVSAFSAQHLPPSYTDTNRGVVSFDVSMPIDATGYTLHGKNLTGGHLQFTDNGTFVSPLLAHETGNIQLPIVTSLKNKPLIKTNINYNAIKFINLNGIDNLFIKVGTATRTQKVAGLDPFVLKNGTYTWKVPIFSAGKEKNDVNDKSRNWQFTEVGTGVSHSHHNGMYTLDFTLYTQANGNTAIAGHPQTTTGFSETLSTPYTTHFNCYAQGIWGSGGSDPYRTLKGRCQGSTHTFSAGPNLDYEYGSFKLPTALSPWAAAPSDHCIRSGKRHSGCTNIKIGSTIQYIAQKIRVPLQHGVFLTASSGTMYRNMNVHNLRYQCKVNVYLKKILPAKDCLKKSYLSGGWSAPYFSVGFELKAKDGERYVARYIYTPEKENTDRLAWGDASAAKIYAVGVSGNQTSKPSTKTMRKYFNEALNVIKKNPAVYNVLGKQFFIRVLKENKLYEKPSAPTIKKMILENM